MKTLWILNLFNCFSFSVQPYNVVFQHVLTHFRLLTFKRGAWVTRSCVPCELKNLSWTSSSTLGVNPDHTSLPRVFLWTGVTLGWEDHILGLWVVTTPVPVSVLYHPSLHRKCWPLLCTHKSSSHKSHVFQSGFYYRKLWRELAFRQFPREPQKSVPLGLCFLSCTCCFSIHAPAPMPASPEKPSSQVPSYV